MKRKYQIWFLLLISCILAGCANKNDIYQIISDKWEKQNENAIVFDFSESMGFEWDTMHIYSGKCSLEDINNDLGFKFNDWVDTGEYIIFTKGDKVVYSQAWYSVDYDSKKGIVFDTLDDKLKFNRNDAKFKVTKQGDTFILHHVFSSEDVSEQDVKDEVLSFSVTTCVKNPEGFVYEDTIVNYDGGEYRPIKNETYENGAIEGIDIYKTEGILSYSFTDLKNDSLLALSINAVFDRKIVIKGDLLHDSKFTDSNGKKFNNKNGDIYVLISDTLLIYKF